MKPSVVALPWSLEESGVPLHYSGEGEAPTVALAAVVSKLWSGQMGGHGSILPFKVFSVESWIIQINTIRLINVDL